MTAFVLNHNRNSKQSTKRRINGDNGIMIHPPSFVCTNPKIIAAINTGFEN